MKFPKLHRYLLKQYKFWFNKFLYKKPKTEINSKLIDKFIISVEGYGGRKMITIWYMVKGKKYCLYYKNRPMMYSVRPGAFLDVKKYLEIIDKFLKDLCKLNKIDPKIENVNENVNENVIDNVTAKIDDFSVPKTLEIKNDKFNVTKSLPKLVADTGPGEIPNSGNV